MKIRVNSALPITITLAAIAFSGNALAGVYKCSDDAGNTSYQSSPCTKETSKIEINTKTGSTLDLSAWEKENYKKQNLESELKKQEEAEAKRLKDLETKRKEDAATQTALNQQLIRNNPVQFSSFAIPPYHADNLPDLAKEFESRLPAIEKFRRLAAQKALKTGHCERVEDNDLSVKSTLNNLVISVSCSTAKTFYYNESELLE